MWGAGIEGQFVKKTGRERAYIYFCKTMRELNLDILKEGLPGITRATGIYLHEAILVALAKNGHRSGVLLKVEGEFETELSLIWKEDVGKAILNIWKNERDAANYGAVGIALLLMTALSRFISFELGILEAA